MEEEISFNKNIDLHERFRLHQLMFRIAGCPIFRTRGSNLVFALSIVCLYVNFTAIIMDIYMNRDNMELAMENARLAFPIASGLCIHQFMRLRRETVEKLLYLTKSFNWDGLPTKDPYTGYLTMSALIPRIYVFTRKLCVILVFIHLIYVFFRTINSEERILQFNSWYPFDTSTSPNFELIYVCQFVGSIMCLLIFAAFISLYATLVAIACSQLEKLRLAMFEIRQKHVSPQQDPRTETDKEEEADQIPNSQIFCNMQRQLNACVRHHQDILEFMRALEAAMNPILLVHFLLIVGGMCFAGFSAITSSGNFIQLAQILVVYIAFVTQLYTYCWFGTELTSQAELVSDAAWCCDWIGSPVSFQRCLIFIIATSKKEFTLTAGQVVPVSNKTMLNIINETISYFMFLLNFKETDADEIQ